MADAPDEITLDAKLYLRLDGFRFDGQRWVDATRPDRPFVPIVPIPVPEDPDMFGGDGSEAQRKYYPKPGAMKLPKRRRRGPQ